MTDRLFIPISRETLEVLLSESVTMGKTYFSLSIPEVAALLIVNHLPSLINKRSTLIQIERHLAGIINIANQHVRQRNTAFHSEIESKFSPALIRQGINSASDHKIQFLPEIDVRNADYLDIEGGWDFSFSRNYKVPGAEQEYSFVSGGGRELSLFDQQFRLFNEFKSDIEENLHVEGYAGLVKHIY